MKYIFPMHALENITHQSIYKHKFALLHALNYSELSPSFSPCMQLCHTSSQWVLNCELLVQRISALEQHVEQLNCCMRSLEEENHQLLNIFSQQQLTSTDEDTQHDSPIPATSPHLQTVENCCASSVFVHGGLEYECLSASACPLHQDVSPHTYNCQCVISGRTSK